MTNGNMTRHEELEQIFKQSRDWLDSLIIETRNTDVGPFKRHNPDSQECLAITSHPFVLVVEEDGRPSWVYQSVTDNDYTSGMAWCHRNSKYFRIDAKTVVALREWHKQTALNISTQLRRDHIKAVVWSADTLRRWFEVVSSVSDQVDQLRETV